MIKLALELWSSNQWASSLWSKPATGIRRWENIFLSQSTSRNKMRMVTAFTLIDDDVGGTSLNWTRKFL